VERWFGLIGQRAIRRHSFRTERELIKRIETFIQPYDETACPFMWTAKAEWTFSQRLTARRTIGGLIRRARPTAS